MFHSAAFLLLISTLVVLSTACSSLPNEKALSTVSPASAPTAAHLPPDTPLPAATQFCMGYSASWSCTCGDLSNNDLQIKHADTSGRCNVSMKEMYSIILPDNWYCNVAGVFARNLSCLTAQGQHIFIQSVHSELAVENADEAVSIFQEGDGYYADPVVGKEEKKITRDLKVIHGRQVLNVLTRKEGVYIVRNFIKNDDNLYIFKAESEDPTEIQGSARILEEAINSLKFIQ